MKTHSDQFETVFNALVQATAGKPAEMCAYTAELYILVCRTLDIPDETALDLMSKAMQVMPQSFGQEAMH